MREIPLSQGKVALVDDVDYADLVQYKWHAKKNRTTWYAERHLTSNTTTTMHRHLMGFPTTQVDHRNGDGLDNQRYNLRKATSAQNVRNRRKQVSHTTSKYKGVSWKKDHNKWLACIRVDYVRKYLGYFATEELAALAYDAAARKYFKDFAYTNIQKAA